MISFPHFRWLRVSHVAKWLSRNKAQVESVESLWSKKESLSSRLLCPTLKEHGPSAKNQSNLLSEASGSLLTHPFSTRISNKRQACPTQKQIRTLKYLASKEKDNSILKPLMDSRENTAVKMHRCSYIAQWNRQLLNISRWSPNYKCSPRVNGIKKAPRCLTCHPSEPSFSFTVIQAMDQQKKHKESC